MGAARPEASVLRTRETLRSDSTSPGLTKISKGRRIGKGEKVSPVSYRLDFVELDVGSGQSVTNRGNFRLSKFVAICLGIV